MVREQVLDDVKLLVEHLPQNQKEVVFMRYYQELSFKEIADITGGKYQYGFRAYALCFVELT